MSIYDKASLVLIPSGSKTSKVYSQKPTNGDGDFTFSRSTAATRVNASGNIEKETQNLLTQSNTLSAWSNFDVTLASGQADKDGGTSAWKVTNDNPYGRVTRDVTASGVNTFSIYAKEGNNPYLRMQFQPVGHDAYFDLSDGSVISTEATIIDAGTEDVGSGWYRVFASVNQTIDNVRIVHTGAGGTGGGSTGDYFYLQDAQLEQGLVARDYIETTTTAIYGGITDNVPRLDYQGSCPALLLEPQRTNLVDYSEYYDLFDNNVTLTTNADTSPEGVDNASKIVVSSESQPRIERYNTWSDSTTYSMSAYVKADTGRYIGFGLYSPEMGNQWVRFDLTNETFGYSDTNWSNAAIVDAGDNWYRISATITTDATNTSKSGFKLASMKSNSYNTGTIGDSFFVYGIQVEQGSYATSYIPTYGSAVTRNVESAVKTLGVSYFPTTGISVFVDFDVTHSSVTNFADLYQLAGSSTQLRLETRTGGRIYIQQGNMVTSGDNFNAYNLCPSTAKKICLTFSSTQVKAYVDGVLINTWNGSYTWDFTDLNIAMQASTAAYNNTMLFPSTLSNQEAIDLTTL